MHQVIEIHFTDKKRHDHKVAIKGQLPTLDDYISAAKKLLENYGLDMSGVEFAYWTSKEVRA